MLLLQPLLLLLPQPAPRGRFRFRHEPVRSVAVVSGKESDVSILTRFGVARWNYAYLSDVLWNLICSCVGGVWTFFAQCWKPVVDSQKKEGADITSVTMCIYTPNSFNKLLPFIRKVTTTSVTVHFIPVWCPKPVEDMAASQKMANLKHLTCPHVAARLAVSATECTRYKGYAARPNDACVTGNGNILLAVTSASTPTRGGTIPIPKNRNSRSDFPIHNSSGRRNLDSRFLILRNRATSS